MLAGQWKPRTTHLGNECTLVYVAWWADSLGQILRRRWKSSSVRITPSNNPPSSRSLELTMLYGRFWCSNHWMNQYFQGSLRTLFLVHLSGCWLGITHCDTLRVGPADFAMFDGGGGSNLPAWTVCAHIQIGYLEYWYVDAKLGELSNKPWQSESAGPIAMSTAGDAALNTWIVWRFTFSRRENRTDTYACMYVIPYDS